MGLIKNSHTLKWVIVGLAVLMISPVTSQATEINVPADYPSISAALSTANSGDTIRVAPGNYSEHNLNFDGKDVHLLATSGPGSTVIDGNGAGPVFLFISGETRSAIIEGFTIRSGSSTDGGGVMIIGASPTLKGNIITDNHATSAGGGISVSGVSTGSGSANPLIIGNSFLSNTAVDQGGGVRVIEASAEIVDNTFTGNQVAGGSRAGGGAVKATLSNDVLISGNTMTNNSATFAGGAVSAFGSDLELTGNTIHNNDGGGFGGGVHIESQVAAGGNRTVRIERNTITNNTAKIHGGGIHSFFENTNSTIIITGNTISLNSCVDPACTSAADDSSDICGVGGGIGAISATCTMTVSERRVSDSRAARYGGAIFAQTAAGVSGNVINEDCVRFNYVTMACSDRSAC